MLQPLPATVIYWFLKTKVKEDGQQPQHNKIPVGQEEVSPDLNAYISHMYQVKSKRCISEQYQQAGGEKAL